MTRYKKKFHVANGRLTNKCQILSEKGWKGMFLLKKIVFDGENCNKQMAG